MRTKQRPSAPSGQGRFSALAQSVILRLQAGEEAVWWRPIPQSERLRFVLPPSDEGDLVPEGQGAILVLASARGKLWLASAERHCNTPPLRLSLLAWDGRPAGRITWAKASMIRACVCPP